MVIAHLEILKSGEALAMTQRGCLFGGGGGYAMPMSMWISASAAGLLPSRSRHECPLVFDEFWTADIIQPKEVDNSADLICVYIYPRMRQPIGHLGLTLVQ